MEAAGRERVGRVGGWECLGGETESEGIADVLPEEDGHEGADAVELDVEIRVEALPIPPPPSPNPLQMRRRQSLCEVGGGGGGAYCNMARAACDVPAAGWRRRC